jgi:putative spermidine/putrescine transport system ATP-binding protein
MAHGGTKAWTSLRPEKIKVVAPGEPVHGNQHTVSGHIISIQYQGAVTRISTDVEGIRIAAVVPALNEIFKEGDPVRLAWETHNLVAMDAA